MLKTLLNSGAIFYLPVTAIGIQIVNSYHFTSVSQLALTPIDLERKRDSQNHFGLGVPYLYPGALSHVYARTRVTLDRDGPTALLFYY
jgi:hypothetical protein